LSHPPCRCILHIEPCPLSLHLQIIAKLHQAWMHPRNALLKFLF
jgi:hypothetical protein